MRFVYVHLVSVVIGLVNACFLYSCNLCIIYPNSKSVPLRKFQVEMATSLVSAGKGLQGRPSLDSMVTPLPQKTQGNPASDVR